MYIVMLKQLLERSSLGAVCVHHIVEGSFWRDLFYVLFVYIVLLKVVY